MYGFAITLIGLAWFTAAALIGSTLGDEWTFGIILSLGHMVAGLMVTIAGIVRVD